MVDSVVEIYANSYILRFWYVERLCVSGFPDDKHKLHSSYLEEISNILPTTRLKFDLRCVSRGDISRGNRIEYAWIYKKNIKIIRNFQHFSLYLW